MRLSRAIAVVLLLHIVAVGGVLAFSLIKDRAPQPSSKTKPAMTVVPPTAPAGTAVTATSPIVPPFPKRNDLTAPAEKIPAVTAITGPGLSAANTTPPAAVRTPKMTTYVVRPGDTLARIASDHGVSLGALIAANEARVTTANLKPGQEVQIPVINAPKDSPKDRPMDEATRLIEAGSPAAPIVAKTPAPNAPLPVVLTAKPAAPALTLLTAKPSAPVATPAPVAAKPATPTATKSSPSAPIMVKVATPAIMVAKAIPVHPSAQPGETAASWQDKTYVVVAGDNPNKLAKRFGVSENALLRANGIDDPRKLRVGQRLVIPSRKPR